jgi:4'-phosphopantetheinyl transferase
MSEWRDCRRGWSAKPGKADAMTLWSAPPCTPFLPPGEVHLWRFPLVCSSVAFASSKTLLSADELRRAERLLDARKAQAFIVGRGRLRQILGAYLQCEPATLDFAYGNDGKPALNKRHDTLHFNLSHSGDWAVLALSVDVALGVDLEKIDPALDYAALSARFFTSAENAHLHTAALHRQRRRFYRLWTRKEALLKGQGRGFSGGEGAEEQGWQLRSFWLAPGYVAAIACAGEMQTLRRWQVR